MGVLGIWDTQGKGGSQMKKLSDSRFHSPSPSRVHSRTWAWRSDVHFLRGHPCYPHYGRSPNIDYADTLTSCAWNSTSRQGIHTSIGIVVEYTTRGRNKIQQYFKKMGSCVVIRWYLFEATWLHCQQRYSRKGLKFDQSIVIYFDEKTLGIDLVLVPTPVVYNYITIVLAELNKRHKTLFQAHEKL